MISEMRCGNIRIHVEIPVYADKNDCFCDDNHVSYSIPAIRKACETASNLPIIQYDEQGIGKVMGVARSIKRNISTNFWMGFCVMSSATILSGISLTG